MTLLNYKKDGTPFLNLLSLKPIFDGEHLGRFMLGCLVDVHHHYSTTKVQLRHVDRLFKLVDCDLSLPSGPEAKARMIDIKRTVLRPPMHDYHADRTADSVKSTRSNPGSFRSNPNRNNPSSRDGTPSRLRKFFDQGRSPAHLRNANVLDAQTPFFLRLRRGDSAKPDSTSRLRRGDRVSGAESAESAEEHVPSGSPEEHLPSAQRIRRGNPAAPSASPIGMRSGSQPEVASSPPESFSSGARAQAGGSELADGPSAGASVQGLSGGHASPKVKKPSGQAEAKRPVSAAIPKRPPPTTSGSFSARGRNLLKSSGAKKSGKAPAGEVERSPTPPSEDKPRRPASARTMKIREKVDDPGMIVGDSPSAPLSSPRGRPGALQKTRTAPRGNPSQKAIVGAPLPSEPTIEPSNAASGEAAPKLDPNMFKVLTAIDFQPAGFALPGNWLSQPVGLQMMPRPSTDESAPPAGEEREE